MFESTEELAQNKLIILFLLNKLNIAVSNGEICQFAIEKDFMDYFSVQEYLSDLCDSGLLEKFKEDNTTWYRITGEGTRVLGFFVERIPLWIQRETGIYIIKNHIRLKSQFQVTAEYTKTPEVDYTAKCCLYNSDRTMLMELSLSLPNKERAKKVCENWRKNVDSLYGLVLNTLADN